MPSAIIATTRARGGASGRRSVRSAAAADVSTTSTSAISPTAPFPAKVCANTLWALPYMLSSGE